MSLVILSDLVAKTFILELYKIIYNSEMAFPCVLIVVLKNEVFVGLHFEVWVRKGGGRESGCKRGEEGGGKRGEKEAEKEKEEGGEIGGG